MKKITDFIINKRHAILVVFILLTVISCFLATKVEINKDLTKYLKEDSETRIGTEIMNEEFKDVKMPSSLSIMFKDLKEEEKEDILKHLSSIKGVSSVNHDETENYNKDGYTLYVINSDEESNTKIAKDIYEEVLETYADYEVYTSGTIKSSNTDILPAWIMITSICCAMIILIIMCESYLEPFLFLISIVIAVILNAGTNIIFDSISEVTNSISAILVMALSMDYSIMLINRFRSERLKEKDDIIAMKNALYHSVQSIFSSSITTIVGLLTLVFMSFTIGRDLGLVLAKGVFLCLLSIFFCLPTLILTFDKWITKTTKKTFNPKLTKLGNLSYKFRPLVTLIFIVLFIGSTLQKGNLSILYTSSEKDKIEEIFGVNNSLALVYKNDFEESIAEYLNTLEQKDKVKKVEGYGNTLNKKLQYNNLNQELNTLGSTMTIEDYLLKILYYHYYNKEENNTMTLNEFYNFIMTDINNNEKLNNITNENIEDLKKLKYFVNYYEIEKLRNMEELSNILGIKEEDLTNILIYYNAKNNNLTLSISEFINFIKNDILTNPKYSDLFNEDSINGLNTIETFINKEYITEYLTKEELSKILNIPNNYLDLILLSKYSQIDNGLELTLNEFTTQIINIKNNTDYLKDVDINLIEYLNLFTNKNFLQNPLNKLALSNLFNNEIVDLVYLSNSMLDTDTIKIEDFINNVLEINNNNPILNEEETNKFLLLSSVISKTLSSETFTSTQISEFLKLDISLTNSLYALIDYTNGNTTSWTISINELVNIMLENSELTSLLDEETLNNLNFLKTIMNYSLNETKLNSEQISNLINIEKSNIDLLYGLYTVNYISNEISLNNIVNFLMTDIVNNDTLSTAFSAKDKTNLNNIRRIMNDSLSKKKYTKDNIYKTLSTLTNKLNQNNIDLIYMYYGSIYNYDINWKLTLEELVYYLNDEILSDERFKDFINDEMKENIIKSKEKVIKSKSLLVADNYSRVIINTNLDFEGDETYNFIENINEELNNNIKDFYIVGDSSMAYEMSKTFNKEFNFISILTMILLMIVVALTFKSFIIPFILVLIIQCAVYLTMGILSVTAGSVYFIAILVVQSILMGATIDYGVVYTSYYLEHRNTLNVKESILASYKSSIHTILTSSMILIIVTFILGIFANDITSKICITISEGTLCSSLLILLILPGTLATFDKLIKKKK